MSSFNSLDIVLTVLSSLGVSAATAAWLSQQLVKHKLSQEFVRYSAEVDATKQYQIEARRRLYLAIGPLKFQLLIAARDVAHRIVSHAGREYPLETSDYYGTSTLYRLVRPLAILELIERQIAFADFSVDQDALTLLQLKRSLWLVLSGSTLVGSHPARNWSREEQHIYYDHVTLAAQALILGSNASEQRVMRIDEFQTALRDQPGAFADQISSLNSLLSDFSISKCPLVWLRLVAFAYACSRYVARFGAALQFAPPHVPLRELILASGDQYFSSRVDEYEALVDDCALATL